MILQFEHPEDYFNDFYFELLESDKRFQILYGGKGSSKSYTISQYLLLYAIHKKTRIVVFRKYQSTNKTSTINLMQDIIDDLNLNRFVTSKEFKFEFYNGSEIYFKGADDPEKLKSVAGVQIYWCEEVTEFNQKDVMEINDRLRGFNRKDEFKLIMSFNPVDQNHWIKGLFFDNLPKDWKNIIKYYHLTVDDNKFIDPEYITLLDSKKDFDFNEWNICRMGNWGRLATGQEAYHHFKVETHTGDYKYDPNMPLHISIDQNVAPYSAFGIFQIVGKIIYMVDEVAMPNKNVDEICNEIRNVRYPDHKAGMFIYGDKTADARSVLSDNIFKLVMKNLENFKPELRLSSKNPPVAMRINFMNHIFYGGQDIKFYINSSCKNTISDYHNVTKNADGTKNKKKTKGVELFGHFSDVVEYIICNAFSDDYDAYIDGNREFIFYEGSIRR